MPFVPLFTVSQTIGLPRIITVNNVSTGFDALIVSQRLYFQTGYDTYLVPPGTTTQYVEWSIDDLSIDADVLDKDYALNVILQFLDASGEVIYTVSSINGFTLYNEQFLYDLTQDQTSIYEIIQDSLYYTNKEIMRCEVDSGYQAVELAADIAGGQSCYDRATNMRLRQNFFF